MVLPAFLSGHIILAILIGVLQGLFRPEEHLKALANLKKPLKYMYS
jgi:hypothetical protein